MLLKNKIKHKKFNEISEISVSMSRSFSSNRAIKKKCRNLHYFFYVHKIDFHSLNSIKEGKHFCLLNEREEKLMAEQKKKLRSTHKPFPLRFIAVCCICFFFLNLFHDAICIT